MSARSNSAMAPPPWEARALAAGRELSERATCADGVDAFPALVYKGEKQD